MREPIVGRFVGETRSEADHFAPCGACGQPFDMRDFEQLAHHETPGHGPYPNPQRLCSASLLLSEALADRPLQPKESSDGAV